MSPEVPYGEGRRMLALPELCEWLNITEQHARKLVARDAIPYRKIGHLLHFAESEVDQWSRPRPRHIKPGEPRAGPAKVSATPKRPRARLVLPKSLIDGPTDQESEHAQRRSA